MGVTEPGPSWTLAATCRCLVEDLGLSSDDCWRALTDLAQEHAVVEAFVQMRSQQPTGGEPIEALLPKLVAFSLHAGRYRAATWHQERAGIVWLLAAGWHEQGSRQDAYTHFERLWQAGRLVPNREDVERTVAMRRPTFERALMEDVPGMRQGAIERPGKVLTCEVGGRVRIRVAYENGEAGILYVAISNHLIPGEMPLPPEWHVQLLAAFFPGIPLADVEYIDEIAGQALRSDEDTFCALIGRC